MYVYVFDYEFGYECLDVFAHVCVCDWVCIFCVFGYAFVYVLLYECVYEFVYVCVYVFDYECKY